MFAIDSANSSRNSANCFSMESVAAFFLSLAVWAATLFFSFLLIIRSSGERWSRFARFLTGPFSSSSCSSLMSWKSFEGEEEGAGLLLPTTAAIGLDERRGEGEEVVIKGDDETIRGMIEGASFSKDFCWAPNIECGMTIIWGGFCILALSCSILDLSCSPPCVSN